MLIVTIGLCMPWVDDFPAQAARNPFISAKRTDHSPDKKLAVRYPAFLQPAMQKIVTVQYAIRQNMVRLAEAIQQQPFGHAFRMFMLFSLLYGMVHAFGPGHGKVYACAYFLNRPGTIKRGLLLSGLTMLIHVLSGTVLILVGALVLKTSGAMTLENAAVVLERISYGLLSGLGMFLAGNTIKHLGAKMIYRPDSCPALSDNKSLVVAALAVGIVPCPGAAMILLFSLTLGILPAGLGAMVFIAAGMSFTTGLFAILTIILKQRFLVLVEGNRRLFTAALHPSRPGRGRPAFTILGLVLFIGSFL